MNHYETLEVSPNASTEVIKAAYKSLMQRYHPDRNPGNAKVAEHASLVIQAYEALSDPNKRAAYDIELERQATDRISNIRGKSRDVPANTALAVKDRESYGLIWLLIVTIILIGWLFLPTAKKQQSPESELKEILLSLQGKQLTEQQKQDKAKRRDEIFKEHPEMLRKDANKRVNDAAARTIPIYIADLNVKLIATDKSSVDPGHVLNIPILGVIVGTFDPEKFIRQIESSNEFISKKLEGKLAYASYDALVKIDGEQYLKKIILDSLDEITGTNRLEDYPSVRDDGPSHYGVVDVLFPESFSIK